MSKKETLEKIRVLKAEEEQKFDDKMKFGSSTDALLFHGRVQAYKKVLGILESMDDSITEEQAWNKIAESYPESPNSLRNLFDNLLSSIHAGNKVTINDWSFLTAKEPDINSGKNLFERAEEMAQEKYRQTIDFDAKNIGVAFANVFRKEKLSEPQYKDTISKENYLEEMISYMEMLYEMDCKDWSKDYGKNKIKD